MSQIILIGDRAVGKTQAVKSLLTGQGKIFIVNAGSQVGDLPTEDLTVRRLDIRANLRSPKRLNVEWVDTPGEWNRSPWQQDPNNLNLLQKYKDTLSDAKAIVLLLRPFRNAGSQYIGDRQLILDNEIPTETQWCKRFERWVNFMNTSCPQLHYLNLCLAKADLFCDNVQSEINEVEKMGWLSGSNYIKTKYFPRLDKFPKTLRQIQAKRVSFFITSTTSRSSLELPWLSLAIDL